MDKDSPLPLASLWDAFGKSALADMLAKTYIEMNRPGASKEVHKMHLDERYNKSEKGTRIIAG